MKMMELLEREGIDISNIKKIITEKNAKISAIIKESFSGQFTGRDEAVLNVENFSKAKESAKIDLAFLKENKDVIIDKIKNLTEGDIKIVINNNGDKKPSFSVTDDVEECAKKGKRGRPPKVKEPTEDEEGATEEPKDDEQLTEKDVDIEPKADVVDEKKEIETDSEDKELEEKLITPSDGKEKEDMTKCSECEYKKGSAKSKSANEYMEAKMAELNADELEEAQAGSGAFKKSDEGMPKITNANAGKKISNKEQGPAKAPKTVTEAEEETSDEELEEKKSKKAKVEEPVAVEQEPTEEKPSTDEPSEEPIADKPSEDDEIVKDEATEELAETEADMDARHAAEIEEMAQRHAAEKNELTERKKAKTEDEPVEEPTEEPTEEPSSEPEDEKKNDEELAEAQASPGQFKKQATPAPKMTGVQPPKVANKEQGAAKIPASNAGLKGSKGLKKESYSVRVANYFLND